MEKLRKLFKLFLGLFGKGVSRNMDGSTDMYCPEDHLGI